MGFIDAVKGLFQSELVQGAIGSTPVGDLGEQLGAQVGDVAAGVEAVGAEAGQLTEVVPGVEALPADLGVVADGVGQLGPDGLPLP